MRRFFVALTALVACGVLAGALATGAVGQDLGLGDSIDNCTVIDEPGEYELGGDVRTNQSETCMEIRSDDVVLEGNGHAIEGPGPDGTDSRAAGVLVNGSTAESYGNVTVRNVEISGFDDGVRSGTDGAAADVALENATVTETDRGVAVHGGSATLTGVTVQQSGGGIYADGADTVEASGVTVQTNGYGLKAAEADVAVDNSTIGYNDGNGVELDGNATLSSTDSRMNGNGGHGIVASGDGVSVELWDDEVGRNGGVGLLLEGGASADLTYTTVPRNAEDGIRVVDGTVSMEDTRLKHNNGYSLDARGGVAHADDLEINQTAFVAFENEPIAVDGVNRAALPDTGNATAVGDGLAVEGDVDGTIEAELTAETDRDAVAVWRHDGDQWEAVAENVSVTNETVQHSIIENGTYAAVESADQESEESDADDADETDGDDSSSGGYSGTSGGSGSSGSSSGSSSGGGVITTETPTPTATEEPTPTATEEPTETPEEDSEGNESETTEESSNEDVAAAEEADEGEDEDGSSLADGPGFGGLAALLALLASAGLLSRRR
jgi:PGF-CTERM protein